MGPVGTFPWHAKAGAAATCRTDFGSSLTYDDYDPVDEGLPASFGVHASRVAGLQHPIWQNAMDEVKKTRVQRNVQLIMGKNPKRENLPRRDFRDVRAKLLPSHCVCWDSFFFNISLLAPTQALRLVKQRYLMLAISVSDFT